MSTESTEHVRDNYGSVSLVAEFERAGIKFNPGGDNEYITKCPNPLHQDNTPSCYVNQSKLVYECKSCGSKGGIAKYLSLATNKPIHTIHQELMDRYDGTKAEKTIDIDVILTNHERIFQYSAFLTSLQTRGIDVNMIRKYYLGVDKHRVIIPIPNEQRQFVNARLYLPDDPSGSKPKYLNTKNRGKNRLYPIEQLKFDKVVICGGELKAIATAERTYPLGWGAITATGGEGSWTKEFSEKLKDKEVAICLDIDAAGIKGADNLARYLTGYAKSIRIVKLPLDINKYPKGDISDYWGKENGTAQEFITLIDNSAHWINTAGITLIDDGVEEQRLCDIILEDVLETKYIRKPVEVTGNVTAIDGQPSIVPESLNVKCSKGETYCPLCPVWKTKENEDKSVDIELKGVSEKTLRFIDVSTSSLPAINREVIGIPSVCKSVLITHKRSKAVTQAWLSPTLDFSKKINNNIYQPIYIIDSTVDLNTAYVFTGKVLPSPIDQKAVIICDKSSEVEDSLDSYEPTEETVKRLEIFRAANIQAKLEDYYYEIETNVTGIIGRRPQHLLTDLVIHSALSFDFDGYPVKRGWVEGLLIGDSSCGKSETTAAMMEYYGVGEKIDCKIATRPGVIGGVAEGNNKSGKVVRWGTMPTQDRRMVMLEELKGMPQDVFAQFTEVRSSGLAKLTMIEKRSAPCRVRLLANSNCRSKRRISDYAFGIESIPDLIGAPEDIRRFDIAVMVSDNDVALEEMYDIRNKRRKVPEAERIYKRALCRERVLWCWTRKVSDISFTSEATKRIYSESINLCKLFDESIPLLDKGSTRLKLAKLSVSLAGMMFSSPDGHLLVVTEEHVNYIVSFLKEIYSCKAAGFLDYSKAKQIEDKISDPVIIEKELMSFHEKTEDLLTLLLAKDDIRQSDFCDWLGVEIDRARELTSMLIRKRALVRKKTEYYKTAPFIELLKKLQVSSELEKYRPPEYLNK